MNATGEPPSPLTAADVARMLGCSAQLVYKLANQELIRCERVGSRLRFRPEWVAEYRARNTTGGESSGS